MAYFRCGGGSGGEKHYATIKCTTNDLFGKTVTCVCEDVEYSKSAVFTDEGECYFTVNDLGTYTLTCEDTIKYVEVTAWYVTYEVEFAGLIVTFADGTDEQIADMLTAHYNNEIDISDYWSVGDSRVLSDGATYIIIGIEHDDLATAINGHTKSAITIWKSNNWTSSKFNTNSANYGYANYSSSVAKGSTVALLNNLSSSERSLVKGVTKKSAYPTNSSNNQALKSSTENIFLLSNYEMFGSVYSGKVTVVDGSQYEYMANNISAITGNLWSRSGYQIEFEGAFAVISNNGNRNGNYVIETYSLAPAICW